MKNALVIKNKKALLEQTIRSANLWHMWSTNGNASLLLGHNAAALVVQAPGEIAVIDRKGRMIELHTSVDGSLWLSQPCADDEFIDKGSAHLVLQF